MEQPKIKNKQYRTTRIWLFVSIIGLLMVFLPFVEGYFLTDAFALVFLGAIMLLSGLLVSRMFLLRARKMDKLLSGEKLLARFQFDDAMRKAFAETLYADGKARAKALMWIIGVLFVIIGGVMLLAMDSDDRLGFSMIFGSVLVIIFMASQFFPRYYYRKNRKGDGQILIGEKYAYFNGYFHNWDFPLSGLSKVKAIKKPFYGIQLTYYYTDRTGRHDHEIKFPVPADYNPKLLILQMNAANKKGKSKRL